MGAPIEDFIVASNANDILTRFVNDGDMSIAPVVPTLSPSMDIQVSSNFERLLFEMNERRRRPDGRAADPVPRDRAGSRSTPTCDGAGSRRPFRAARFDDDDVHAEIARVYKASGMLIDPHTATGTLAAAATRRLDHPVVTMATAHPAKFPDAVERATGVRPMLPDHLADLFDRPERTETASPTTSRSSRTTSPVSARVDRLGRPCP